MSNQETPLRLVVMRLFCKEFLEPIGYLIYSIAIFMHWLSDRKWKYKLLSLFYFLVSVLVLFASFIHINGGNNNFIYNLLYLLTNVVVSLFFYSILETTCKKRIVILLFFTSFIVFVSIIIGYYGLFTVFNGFAIGTVFISLVFCCFLYFHQLLNNVKEDNVLHDFDFWLISSYLIYFLGAALIMIYYEKTDIYKRANLWIAQSVILFISSLIITRGTFQATKYYKA